jgi:hypothetical protein
MAVIPTTMTRGKITKPGEMVENVGKNWRIAMPRKKLVVKIRIGT